MSCGDRREPGARHTREFDQYTGFGCSIKPGEVWYTLGYENAPWFFLIHISTIREHRWIKLLQHRAGEAVEVRMYRFDIPGDDERCHDALKWVYRKYHESPRRLCSVQETVRDMANAIARDAWLPEIHAYSCFVFDKEAISNTWLLPPLWTNGLAAAVPMLASALR